MLLSSNPTKPRKGLSLTEVLAAIFILAIGALSVLVLFPVAALKVRQAMDNENIALVAANGSSSLKMVVRAQKLSDPTSDFLGSFFSGTGGPGNNWRPVGNGTTEKIAILDNFFSGAWNISHDETSAYAIGNSIINRQTIPRIDEDKFLLNQDLIEFESNGSVLASVVRSKKFSCGYLIKRTETVPPAYSATVLVYQNRNIISGIPENIREMTLDSTDANANRVGDSTISVTRKIPTVEDGRAIQPGAWLLVTQAGTEGLFDFYQVTKVTPKSGDGVLFELNKTISNQSGERLSVKCYWIDTLVGVFPKGTITTD